MCKLVFPTRRDSAKLKILPRAGTWDGTVRDFDSCPTGQNGTEDILKQKKDILKQEKDVLKQKKDVLKQKRMFQNGIGHSKILFKTIVWQFCSKCVQK